MDYAKNITVLFQQLGLPSQDADIEHFIKTHPLSPDIKLHDAPFWNTSQADFLKSAFEEDSDWAIPMDELNQRLHSITTL